jgi:hypothetical protein
MGITTEYKVGGYDVPAGAVKHPFTFWWGHDAKDNEFFDVSISPDLKTDPTMKPLLLEKEIAQFDGTPRQPVIILKITNENTFAVHFNAHHVRIYP